MLRFTWYSSTGNTLFSDEIDDKKEVLLGSWPEFVILTHSFMLENCQIYLRNLAELILTSPFFNILNERVLRENLKVPKLAVSFLLDWSSRFKSTFIFILVLLM